VGSFCAEVVAEEVVSVVSGGSSEEEAMSANVNVVKAEEVVKTH